MSGFISSLIFQSSLTLSYTFDWDVSLQALLFPCPTEIPGPILGSRNSQTKSVYELHVIPGDIQRVR